MAVVRACAFLVIFLWLHVAIAKPMFGLFWCEIACVDDDDAITTTTESRVPDMDDLFCGACPPRRRRRTTTPNPLTGVMLPPGTPPFVSRLPNGVNVNMWPSNNAGMWAMNYIPWNQAQGPGLPPGAPAIPNAPAAPSVPAASTLQSASVVPVNAGK